MFGRIGDMKTKIKKAVKTKFSSAGAGTYVYDEASGKVIKFSERIPGVSGKRRSSVGDFSAPSCAPSQCCGGGACGNSGGCE